MNYFNFHLLTVQFQNDRVGKTLNLSFPFHMPYVCIVSITKTDSQKVDGLNKQAKNCFQTIRYTWGDTNWWSKCVAFNSSQLMAYITCYCNLDSGKWYYDLGSLHCNLCTLLWILFHLWAHCLNFYSNFKSHLANFKKICSASLS